MSTNWTLGSFIPNPVIADTVAFLELDDKITFVLSSPHANDIVHRYRVLNNIHASEIRFSSDEDNNLIVYLNSDNNLIVYLKAGRSTKPFNTFAKCGTQKAEAFIVRLLGMCGSIGNLAWGRNESFKCILNAKIYNKLRTLPLCGLLLIYGNFDLTADQLLELRSKFGRLGLHKCQVSSDLVTDEIFQKLCEKECWIEVEPALSNTENRTLVKTTVSDRFLNSLIKSSNSMYISFGNFHTKFTIDGIKRVVTAFPDSHFNFGILDVSQTDSAHAFWMEMSNRTNVLESELLVMDGQYFICYQSSQESPLGSVRLSLPIPSNLSSTSAANIDEELDAKSHILTSLFLSDNAKLPESKEVRIRYQRKENRCVNSSSNTFCFEIIFNNSYKRSFLLTDIDEKTAAKVIKTCLKECENVDRIYWGQLDFSNDVYAYLKTISEKCVGFTWSQTTLSSQNLVEFFLNYPQITGSCLEKGDYDLPARYLTNEFVSVLLLNEIAINVVWIGEKKEAVTTLTDELLVRLAERNSPFAIRLSIKGYRTGLTIQGIKTLTPKLGVIGSIDPSELSFTVNDGEEITAVRFLSSIQLNPESIWRIVATKWDNGFLQSFKITSNVHGEIFVEVDFDSSKNTVVNKHDRCCWISITESNYQKLLASGEYIYWHMEYFLKNNFQRLDLLDMMMISYDYDLDYVKENVKKCLNDIESDFIFDARFFCLPFDQQSFVLNMVYNQHNKGMYSYPERFNDVLFIFSDYCDVFDYSDDDW